MSPPALFGAVLVTGVLTVDTLYIDDQVVQETSQDTEISYISGNGFGAEGDSGLTYNNSNGTLQVANVSPFPDTTTWDLQNVDTTGSTTITANNTTTSAPGGSIVVTTAHGNTPSGHGIGGSLTFTGATTTTGGTTTFVSGNKGGSTGCSLVLGGANTSIGGGSVLLTGDGFVATGTLSTVSATTNNVSVLGGNAIGTNNGGNVTIVAATNLSVATEATTTGTFSKVFVTTNGVEYRLPSGSDVVVSTPTVGSLIGISTGGGTSSATTEAITISNGATLSSGGVLSLASQYITTSMITSGAVTTVKIVDGAVGPAALEDTTVTPGSYTRTSMTVTADGRLTTASSGGNTVGATYVYRTTPIALNTDSTVIFDTIAVGGTDPAYDSGTGVFSLTSGKLYRAFFSIQHSTLNASVAALTLVWQNASTLASIGSLTAFALSNEYATSDSNSSNVDILISGTTHATVRVYVTNATLPSNTSGFSCGAFIYEINK